MVKQNLPIQMGPRGELGRMVGSEGSAVRSMEEKLARKLRPYSEKRYELVLVRLEKVSEADRKLLLEFDRKLTAQGLSFGRKSAYLDILMNLRRLLGKSFKDVTREDIERVLADLSSKKSTRGKKYADLTINNYRIALKRFYKWLLGDDEEYPELVRWVKTTPKHNQLPRESLLSNEDIETLVRACDNPRDRAIVLVLAESGVRAGELLSLRVGDVRPDQYGMIITVSGKTGDRAVRLIASAPAVATWLDHHPKRDDPTATLWVNIGTKFKGTALTCAGLSGIIRRLKASSGIKKRVHPHGFRHTAATRLARLLTEAEMKSYLGWVPGSDMASVYVHLSSRDVDKSLLRIHGLITEDEDKERKFTATKCPRCNSMNSPGTSFCAKCGLPLTFEAAKEIDEKLAFKRALLEKVMQMPEFNKIKDLIEALGEKALTE